MRVRARASSRTTDARTGSVPRPDSVSKHFNDVSSAVSFETNIFGPQSHSVFIIFIDFIAENAVAQV